MSKLYKRIYEKRRLLFNKNKKNLFIILISISFITIFILTMINTQLASAYPSFTSYCNNCHQNDMPNTWITVTIDNQTQTTITYYVTGSDNYNGEEGWAVFDSSLNNIENGINTGYFTLPKDGETYRVFWVDNGPDKGGSAFEDITTPSNNNAPYAPTIDGPSNGKPGVLYTYEFCGEDPDNDDIIICVSWGDDSGEVCVGPIPSGNCTTLDHTWSSQGKYTISAYTRDINGAQSDNSTFSVTMPRNRVLQIPLFQQLFKLFPNAFPILRFILTL